jgi:Predicted transcriptional regulator
VFSRKWLREQNLPAQDDLRVIYAKGDSMFPFIEDGQVLLVNPHDVTPKSNKVYFLCIDGQYFVKRLINMVTHWVIRSDNPDKVQYPDIKLSMDDIRENIEIEGRICWKGGSM